MTTDFLRDALFSTGWLGLMGFVWFGWGQEDPPKRLRPWLGVGSGVGLLLAGGFGVLVWRHWDSASALDGRFHWFGVLVGAELVAAGVGCVVLAVRRRPRWMAWWVAVVVAAHFLPLAVLLADPALAVVGGLQVVALAWCWGRLRRGTGASSALVGPVMGTSLVLFSIVSALLVLPGLLA